MEWNNDFTLEFLEMYQEEPAIWDPANADHKRKEKVAEAWARLSDKTGKPIPELKKKKDSLMATFRGHRRRKKASVKSGSKMYKPVWFAFEFMEGFLARSQHPNGNTLFLEETSETIEPTSQLPIANVRITEDIPPAASTRNLRRKNPCEPRREAESQAKDTFTLLTNVVSKHDDRREDDDCDLYGKILAKKLRNLPEFDRQVLWHDIDGMVINAIRDHRQSLLSVADSTSPSDSTRMLPQQILQLVP